MKVAIVGTGVSGLVCAHELQGRHEITVFEADDRVGGHCHTVRVDLADESHDVDTGFIVYNERTYPGLTGLFAELGVVTQPSDMSFSVSDAATGFEYRPTTLATTFAQRSNLARPWFLRMLVDIARFNRTARRLVAHAPPPGAEPTLGELLADGGYGRPFVERYLVPLGTAIWSADPAAFLAFPAAPLARFMDNHGLLAVGAVPPWRTVTGGSQRYVAALSAPFAHRIRLRRPVRRITRRSDGLVEVDAAGGPAERFDRVVIATHSDQALALLGDPSRAEREILGALRYQRNVATLHTDASFLPRRPAARASWNCHLGAGDGQAATVTYWMNKLQALESRSEILVTLNRADDVAPGAVIDQFEYHHPVLDHAALAAQRRRGEIQGRRHTYFAGAYWGYGFHEDGLRSALDVCRRLHAHHDRVPSASIGVADGGRARSAATR